MFCKDIIVLRNSGFKSFKTTRFTDNDAVRFRTQGISHSCERIIKSKMDILATASSTSGYESALADRPKVFLFRSVNQIAVFLNGRNKDGMINS